MAEIESTGSVAPSTDTAAAPAAASPSPAPESSSSPAAGSAGEKAVPTDARSVWNEMAGKSEGTPPDAPQDSSHAKPATQADESPEAPGSLPTRGPIPIDRHQAVVTNTRRKTLAEYGIEESVQADGTVTRNIAPERVKNALALATLAERDPKLAIRLIQAHLGEEATAASSRPAEKPVEDPEPQPDIELNDGRAVYSAQALRDWHQWNRREQKREAQREQEDHNRLVAGQKVEAQHIVAHATKNWPHFAEHKAAIKELLANIPAEQWTASTLHEAYISVLRDKALPGQRQAWETERSGQLTRKAAASSIQPGAPRPSTPRPDSQLSSMDIVRDEWRRAAG